MLLNHWAQLGGFEGIIWIALGLLVRLGALLRLLHVAHDFTVDLIYILLGCRKFLLQSDFLLLQGILGTFCELIDETINFRLHFALIHGVNHIFSIRVELRREDLRHSLRRVRLVHTGRLLDELLKRLMPAHRLIKRAQEVLVELLLRVLVQLVVLLQKCLLRTDLR